MEVLAEVGVWIWPVLSVTTLLIVLRLFNHDKRLDLLKQKAETHEQYQKEQYDELIKRIDNYHQAVIDVISVRNIS